MNKMFINRFIRKLFLSIVSIKSFDPFWEIIGKILTERTDLYEFWEKYGFHVVRDHFYEPLPNVKELKSKLDLWKEKSKLIGVDMNESYQIDLLKTFSSKFKDEYDRFPRKKPEEPSKFYIGNGSFDCIDAEILYSMIRDFKPKRIIEIGAGNSTKVAAKAVLKNREENHECELITIDPYPYDYIQNGIPGLKKIIPKKVQNIPLDLFTTLEENDILFIDSSHILTIGNDVHYLFLEVLPRLNKGVFVQIHDIFLPIEYPKEWVLNVYRFYNEQYLLQAFLSFNEAFEVVWGSQFMHLKHPDLLEEAIDVYERNWSPGSFWIKRIN